MLGEIFVSNDASNIWEILTAIGTVGAVIISLGLIIWDNKKKASFQVTGYEKFERFNTENNSKSVVSLRLFNNGKIPITIIEAGVTDAVKKIKFVNDKKHGRSATLVSQEGDQVKGVELPYVIEAFNQGVFRFDRENVAVVFPVNEFDKITFYLKEASGKYYYKTIENKIRFQPSPRASSRSLEENE